MQLAVRGSDSSERCSHPVSWRGAVAASCACAVLARGQWKDIRAVMPDGAVVACRAAKLATVVVPKGKARLFVAQLGGIDGVHRGTIIGLSSVDARLSELVRTLALARWIRGVTRNKRRPQVPVAGVRPQGAASAITARSNIVLARKQDIRARRRRVPDSAGIPGPRGLLGGTHSVLNIVELFAGAGGMGLGFLLGGGARSTLSNRVFR